VGGNSRVRGNLVDQTAIQRQLFSQYAQTGVPIVRGAQQYIRGALDVGEPSYVAAAYDAARGGAGEEAMAGERALRGQLEGREAGALLQGLAGATGRGGRAFLEERSAIDSSRAVNTVEQRNQMLRLLSGQGAQATNLAQGFGQLGMTGVGMGLGAGNPLYEAIIGAGSAGTAGYLNWLTTRPPQLPASTNSFSSVYSSHPGAR
jgi:hypothetical protein